ncbi:hypothetical protein COCON_G00148620 [Conger conger]|uniref:Uncharacterized protein n=1 Tax=Conger conger TaxID=82655 RepID=A0A9Q1DC64_CONCO|nr:hypothetical protein COCON_G00148620 [Conger conger]
MADHRWLNLLPALRCTAPVWGGSLKPPLSTDTGHFTTMTLNWESSKSFLKRRFRLPKTFLGERRSLFLPRDQLKAKTKIRKRGLLK